VSLSRKSVATNVMDWNYSIYYIWNLKEYYVWNLKELSLNETLDLLEASILKASKKLKFIFCLSPLFVSTRSWSKPPVFILESQQIPIIKETLFAPKPKLL
jgi:hypothetical protein